MSDSESIEPFLEDLEQRIDEDVENRLLQDWQRFCELRWDQPLFKP